MAFDIYVLRHKRLVVYDPDFSTTIDNDVDDGNDVASDDPDNELAMSTATNRGIGSGTTAAIVVGVIVAIIAIIAVV